MILSLRAREVDDLAQIIILASADTLVAEESDPLDFRKVLVVDDFEVQVEYDALAGEHGFDAVLKSFDDDLGPVRTLVDTG